MIDSQYREVMNEVSLIEALEKEGIKKMYVKATIDEVVLDMLLRRSFDEQDTEARVKSTTSDRSDLYGRRCNPSRRYIEFENCILDLFTRQTLNIDTQ